jgi:hypothetical protein
MSLFLCRSLATRLVEQPESLTVDQLRELGQLLHDHLNEDGELRRQLLLARRETADAAPIEGQLLLFA